MSDVTSVHIKYISVRRFQYRPLYVIYHKSEQNRTNITVKHNYTFLTFEYIFFFFSVPAQQALNTVYIDIYFAGATTHSGFVFCSILVGL